MSHRTPRLLTAALLVLALSTACSGDDEKDEDPSGDPTLAGPSESLAAPPGSGESDLEITKTEVCPHQVAGGKADGRFYGSITRLAGGSLKLTAKVDHPAKKGPKKRTVEALVDSGGNFVAVFSVYGEGETLTLDAVDASGTAIEVPDDATLEVESLDVEECAGLDVPIPPIAEDD